jgi:hypothetical protein
VELSEGCFPVFVMSSDWQWEYCRGYTCYLHLSSAAEVEQTGTQPPFFFDRVSLEDCELWWLAWFGDVSIFLAIFRAAGPCCGSVISWGSGRKRSVIREGWTMESNTRPADVGGFVTVMLNRLNPVNRLTDFDIVLSLLLISYVLIMMWVLWFSLKWIS